MLPTNKIIRKLAICFLMAAFSCATVNAQTTQPTWWFGVSGAANFNFYGGTTQQLTNSLIVPTAFHRGQGVRPYGSVLVEYRPAGIWGLMLNVGYDGRGGKFNNEVAPCNCLATLKTEPTYVSIEPALRISVPSTGLYFFVGPRIGLGLSRDFSYTQVNQPNTNAQLSNMHKTVFSGQVGLGYDIQVSSANSTTKVSISPFVSFQPYFGQEPRNIESWTITTARAGIALKFGKAHRIEAKQVQAPIAVVMTAPVHDFILDVRGPKTIPVRREVSETLPLLNAVFFDESSTEIPNRYVLLSKDQATNFKEGQLQQEPAVNMPGRSAAQLNVYHNILNILGDRMRSNPGTVIVLNGASAKGPKEGRVFAESVKSYLVTVFGIDGSRISVQGSFKPHPPSEKPGGTKDLALLAAENRRVDIESTSPELLMELGGGMMRSVQMNAMQEDPLDSHVVFTVDSARQLLKSWSIDVTASNGTVQHYGPYTRDHESVSAKTILGGSPDGDYKITMLGETNNGTAIKKESSIHLVRQDDIIVKGVRYSIVFSFDRATTIASYNNFLTNTVSPLITDGSTVIIHGHTDIIGEEVYNQKLSDSRAQQTQQVIEHALAASGKSNVKFETLGYGKDASHSPFENNLPEERFYNRTVIIDIIH
jgi:outer membrane protein OmpA-like peptidoglycan-associated protein